MLVVVALLLVAVWPTSDDRSLALKFINWAVDPSNNLPVMPGPLDMESGDDADAVNAHDQLENYYYSLYDKGGWMRTRLELKVLEEPFNPATERQALTAIAILTAFVVWRMDSAKQSGTKT